MKENCKGPFKMLEDEKKYEAIGGYYISYTSINLGV